MTPYSFIGLPEKIQIQFNPFIKERYMPVKEHVIAIQTIIAAHYNIPTHKYMQRSRKREMVTCRQILFYFLDMYRFGYTKSKIAEVLLYDHATMLHAVKRIEGFVEVDKIIRQDCVEIEKKIKEYLINTNYDL